MRKRKIVNDLDFEVAYRLIKKKDSRKRFKELKAHGKAVIPHKDLGHVRLEFRMPKHKDMEISFNNHIQVLSVSSIQSEEKCDVYSYHLIICGLSEEWNLMIKDEDIELVKPEGDKE